MSDGWVARAVPLVLGLAALLGLLAGDGVPSPARIRDLFVLQVEPGGAADELRVTHEDGNSRCGPRGQPELEVHETARRVTVIVTATGESYHRGSGTCTSLINLDTTTVRLAEPLGDRQVVDRYGTALRRR